MAYETGTAIDIDDLIDSKLKDFMVAQGWTLNSDNWPTHLAMSKGNCYVNLRHDTSSNSSGSLNTSGTSTFNDAFSVARVDTKLWAHLSSGYTATDWEGQPDSPVNSTGTGEPFVLVNDLTGPFVSYSIFSGDEVAGDPAYIYLVAESTADHFVHLMFGNVDQGTLTYSPGSAFLTGMAYEWFPNSATVGSRRDIEWFDSIHRYPFTEQQKQQYHCYGGGALPGEEVRPTTNNSEGMLGLYDFVNQAPLPGASAAEFADGIAAGNGGKWGTGVFARGPIGLNGISPLFPVPIITRNLTDNNVVHYLGQAPGLRFVSMFGRIAGEEITIGSDTFVVYPARHADEQGSEIDPPAGSPTLNNSSWRVGFAFKKVV